MSGETFESIMAQLVFSIAFFLVLLLIFFCIRNKRDKGNMLLN